MDRVKANPCSNMPPGASWPVLHRRERIAQGSASEGNSRSREDGAKGDREGKELMMVGLFDRTADGTHFVIDDRRYRLLSPMHCNARGRVVLTLALDHGANHACHHQDEVTTSTVNGRHRFARRCLGLEAQVIEQDLLALDAAVRQSLAEEAAQDDAHGLTALPHGSRIEEGEHAYFRLQAKPNGNEERTPISSFVIIPKLRVCIDGAEAIQADLKLPQQIVPDVTFERRHWRSRGLFLRALPTLDLWCTASNDEIQHIQGIVAGKAVPRKQGTRALGSYDGRYWVTPDGVLDAHGWMADPPVVYLPHGEVCPLADSLRYRMGEPGAALTVAQAFYERVWALHDAAVIGPMIGWFFAVPFKPLLHRHLGHFPILYCWGTRGGGKTSLLQLFWRLFGVDSAVLPVPRPSSLSWRCSPPPPRSLSFLTNSSRATCDQIR